MKPMITFLFCIFLFSTSNSGATTWYVDKVTSKVGGDQMDGMLISIDFANSEIDVTNAVWKDLGDDSGGASGDGWSLTFTGNDTWDSAFNWQLYSEHFIKAMTINAFAGSTVFDIRDNLTGLPDTPGSDRGWWDPNGFTENASYGTHTISGQEVTWRFVDDVALSNTWPNAGVGDLYGSLILTFNSPTSFPRGNLFEFQLDTDHAVIPEPTTLILLGVGLIGIAGIGSKRKNAKNEAAR